MTFNPTAETPAETSAEKGHLFVLRGDLTKLSCDAVFVPCDSNWEVVWKHWEELLPKDRFVNSPWGRRYTGTATGNSVDLGKSNPRVRLVVSATGGNDADAVARSAFEAVRDTAESLRAISEPAATENGRAKPLIGMSLLGVGAGGFARQRGKLIRVLLPQLREAAHTFNVDIALVLRDERDHAAVQSLRDDQSWSEDLSDAQAKTANELGCKAAHGELSLFLGAGVSVPLGLPGWQDLLEKASGQKIRNFTPESAPADAEELGKRLDRTKMVEMLDTRGCAPAHLLLAALGVRQHVTTNYDAAFEQALESNVGSAYRVLTTQTAQQPEPWLLKVHGDVKEPETMVITTADYARLENETSSIWGVVESLLLTSHLLFVGYSMGDPPVVKAGNRVRKVRGLAAEPDSSPIATVLTLKPASVKNLEGFDVQPMVAKRNETIENARHLEVFLDRVSWAAARDPRRSQAYLLDPDYEDLFAGDEATQQLRDLLGPLLDRTQNQEAQASKAWGSVELLLNTLGAHPKVPKESPKA